MSATVGPEPSAERYLRVRMCRRVSTRVAFVTGASRGIGKAIAVHLAKAGYDVAVSARTVEEGEEREHSSTLKKSDTRPMPGSLATTAGLVGRGGRAAFRCPH